MDQRMNEYGGCQPSYQGYGYDQQQGYYMDNQGPYHHQQWNNQEMYHQQQWNTNYQDPYSFSSQYQESSSSFNQCQGSESTSELLEIRRVERLKVARLKEIVERMEKDAKQREEDEEALSVVDEVLESPKEDEMDPSSSTSRATHEAHCEVTNQSHIDKMQFEENERRIEDFIKRLTSSNDQGCANDEGCAKSDSNKQASETLAKEKCDHSKVKESLQVLLESEDLGIFHSKVDHLRFILDNKEILGDLLQEFEEEQGSNLHMKTMFEEAPSIEKKETIRSMEVPQVEHVVKTTNVLWHLPSVVGTMEKLQPLKSAKRKRRKRRKKPKKTKDRGIAPKPPLLTFTPLRFVDGKLECKVSSKGGHKPFSKVRILLSPSSKGDDWSAINKAMVKTFSMKLGDRGPLSKPKVPNG